MTSLVMIAGYLATLWLSWYMTRRFLLFALERRLVDVPNERSSHSRITPRGGGIAFVVPFLAEVAILGLMRDLPIRATLGIFAGFGLAIIGYLDDQRGLSVKFRFVAQLAITSLALELICGEWLEKLHHPVLLIASVFIAYAILYTWLINLVNFMDGIDGLAASGTVSVCVVCCVLVSIHHGVQPLGFLFGLLACAVIGFLYWNWPSAHIFMGDAGSYFLGFTIGALMMLGVLQHLLGLYVIPIMLGVFVVDASLTTVNRMLRRERWYRPHRLFGFQHAADAFGHRAVTIFVIMVNTFWLAPAAILAEFFPEHGVALLLLAWSPLVAIAYLFHAGEVLTKDGMPRWRTMLLIVGWHGHNRRRALPDSFADLGAGWMRFIRACFTSVICVVSIGVAISSGMGGPGQAMVSGMKYLLVVYGATHLTVLFAFGVHRWHWHLISLEDLPDIAGVCLVATLTGVVGGIIVNRAELFRLRPTFFIVQTVLLIGLIILFRMVAAALSHNHHFARRVAPLKRVIIYGANGLGLEIVSNLRRLGPNYRVAGFVDPRHSVKGIPIAGVRVLGVDSEIEKLVATYHVDEVLVSSSTASSAAGRHFLKHCREASVGIRVVPSLEYSLAATVEPNPMQA